MEHRHRLSYILIPLLAGCSSHAVSDVKRSRNIDTAIASAHMLRPEMMKSHNDARAQVGAAPLIWDDGLAQDAQIYANILADKDIFEHDPQNGKSLKQKPFRQGENLWKGTSGFFSFAQMADGWVSEKKFFKNGVFPDNSNNGNWSDVGHYTQIIWPTTDRIGCAIAQNSRDDFLVCRYSPAGNIIGVDPLKR